MLNLRLEEPIFLGSLSKMEVCISLPWPTHGDPGVAAPGRIPAFASRPHPMSRSEQGEGPAPNPVICLSTPWLSPLDCMHARKLGRVRLHPQQNEAARSSELSSNGGSACQEGFFGRGQAHSKGRMGQRLLWGQLQWSGGGISTACRVKPNSERLLGIFTRVRGAEKQCNF